LADLLDVIVGTARQVEHSTSGGNSDGRCHAFVEYQAMEGLEGTSFAHTAIATCRDFEALDG